MKWTVRRHDDFARGEKHIRIDVFHPSGRDQFGVNILAEYVDGRDDEVALLPALRVLNHNIRNWPVLPITPEMVRTAL